MDGPDPRISRRDALRLAGAGVASIAVAPVLGQTTGPADEPLRRPIPSTGELLPAIGLGTWQTFDVGPAPEDRRPLAEVLRAFAEGGGRVVDSSPMYGRAEQVVGDLAAELGLAGRLFLATKVWTSGRDAGVRQMQASLRKLGVDHVDLMQVHNLLDADVHLDTLAGWRRDGRARHVGVTHYTAAAHDDLIAAIERHRGVDVVQVNYSVAEPEAERRLLPLARDRGVAVIANRPFAGGGLLRRLLARPLPDFAAEVGCASWPQLLLKWTLGHPAVTCAIPATSKARHVRDNLRAAVGPLPDEAMRARIAAAARA